MRYFELGPERLRLSRVVLGGHEYLPDGRSRAFNEDLAAAVTPGVVFPGFGGPQRKAVLATAYDLGINLFDVTMDSEKEALGRNLSETPPPYEVFVQTRPEGMVYGYDPGNRRLLDFALLKAEVERCLKLLRRERIDILNIGILSDALAKPGYLSTLADNLDTLRRLGLIRYAAADTFSGEATYLAMIESGAFASININFNIADDGAADAVFKAADDAGVAIVTREIFAKGQLFAIARNCNHIDLRDLASAATKWASHNSAIDALIVGAADAAQLRANAAAISSCGMTEAETVLLTHIIRSEEFQALQNKQRRAFLASGAGF